MSQDAAVPQLEDGQLLLAGRGDQLVARSLSKERDRTAVTGDDLVVFDPGGAHRLLDAAARVHAWTALVAVTDVQRRPLVHAQSVAEKLPAMNGLVGAIDQGTASTRFVLFDRDARIVAIEQREHRQLTPRPGWVEHDASEIWQRTREVIAAALATTGASGRDLAAIGIANQRETTVVWDRSTGVPIHPAIVWQDTRTADLVRELAADAGVDRLRERVGLPLSTYFSGPKIAWILDRVDGARTRAQEGEVLFGTIDSWLLWNLTGGTVHATDVTNASRTMLMDLETLAWHEPSLELMGIPRAMLPEIRSSSEVYGEAAGLGAVAGMLGDQQAALFGQTCFERGEAKNTYGTGSFVLVNTGSEVVALAGAPDERRLPARRGGPAIRARGIDRRHRRPRPMASRPARDHLHGRRGRVAREERRRTTAGSTSSRRSRVSSLRTGATTRAG